MQKKTTTTTTTKLTVTIKQGNRKSVAIQQQNVGQIKMRETQQSQK